VLLTLDDFETAARLRLPRALYGFAANGSERGTSVFANARSFERWSFVPRTLVDVASISQTRSLFGESYAAPFGISPMGGCALYAHHADLALARAAHAIGVPFVLSAASSVPLEQVMDAAPRSWYQGYIPGDEDRIGKLITRLRTAKVSVLVITADVPVASNRDRDRKLGFTIPLRPRMSLVIDGLLHPRWLLWTCTRTLLTEGVPTLPNFGGETTGRPIISVPTTSARSDRDRFTWEHVALIRRLWDGALMIKGILSADDTVRAKQAGVDGVIVSNHGGRQLDGAASPLDVLSEVLDAAGPMPVCLDGGIRRGTDVLKAIALGAHMVFVGRPMLYAVSVAAQSGVESAVRILQGEVKTSLALIGCTRIDDLNRMHLRAS
jgi:L-lactate dehydrogenase (cytochrome)